MGSASSFLSATKSLTAFKSLPNSRSGIGHSIAQAGPWIQLLATDLITRVQCDANRNGRFPKTCTLHYTKLLLPGEQSPPLQSPPQQQYDRNARSSVPTQSKSVRLEFPPHIQQQQQQGAPGRKAEAFSPTYKSTTTEVAIQTLCQIAATILRQREGATVQLTRLGFTATDFVQRYRPNSASIDHYFSTSKSRSISSNGGAEGGDCSSTENTNEMGNNNSKGKRKTISNRDKILQTIGKVELSNDHRREHQQQKQQEESPLLHSAATEPNSSSASGHICSSGVQNGGVDAGGDRDLALAQKLQAEYDREDRAWNRLGHSQQKKKQQRPTIKSFFGPSKKEM